MCAQIRREAYTALAAYPFEILEGLEALRPFNDYAKLLLSEDDSNARSACEVLTGAALAHEYSQRRR